MLILVKSVWHWLRVFIDKCTHVCRWVKTVNRVFRPNVNSAVHLQSLFRDADWHKFASDILNRGKYPSVQVPNIVKDFLLSFSHRLWILLAIRNGPKPYYSFWATAAVWFYFRTVRRGLGAKWAKLQDSYAQIFVDFQKYFSSRSVWTQPKFIFSICCLFNINIWLQIEWITHLFNRSPFFSRLPDLVQSVEV